MNYKALIIAVDQYSNANDNLPNTVNDAIEINRLLLEDPSLFREQDVQLFRGSISKKHILLSALQSFFEEAIDTDVLFLFWAGHGAFINNEGYFVPVDGNIYSPEASLIKMSQVRDLIDQTAANTVLSFFDTCHSGAITRSVQNEMQRGLEVKGSGKVLIAACTTEQGAADRQGHGAFTDYLIQGLEGEAADRNGDIDVYNLYSYVSKKLNEEMSGSNREQNPVIKSTLNGKPLLLKRTVSRTGASDIKTQKSTVQQMTSSGVAFWLGSIITEYDEFYNKNKGEYQIKLINPDSKVEQALKDMRSQSKIPFVVKDEADIVSVEDMDIKSTREGTSISINLKSKREGQNSIHSEMSYSTGMGKTLSPDDVAVLRIRYILFGEKDPTLSYGSSAFESMIYNFPNVGFRVTPGLIAHLSKQGEAPENIRVITVGHLILTGIIDKIEELSFILKNEVVSKVHLVGYRPKYYSNVDPKRIEINEEI